MRFMVRYIDVLIFTNVIINYCILSASKKFLHIKTSQIRIVLASIWSIVFSNGSYKRFAISSIYIIKDSMRRLYVFNRFL